MQDFINEWLSKRIDYDHIYGYQCVDLIKQYLYERFGLSPGAWGNAKDYWLNTNPAILARFDKLSTTDVRAGDILPLKPVDNLPSHSNGHVGIATGAQTATMVEILEQNGSTGGGTGTGPDAIRKRFVPKTRMYGALRPKSAIPAHIETVKAGNWNVRRDPSLSGAIMGLVGGGQQYNTVIVGGDWRRINFNGANGYVGPKAWS